MISILKKLCQYNNHIPLSKVETTLEQGWNFEVVVPILSRHYEYDFAILVLQKRCQYNIHSTQLVELTSQRWDNVGTLS